MSRVLVVDEDPKVRAFVSAVTYRTGFVPYAAATVAEAIGRLDRGAPDLVISDAGVSVGGGLSLLRAVRQRYPHVPVVMMAAVPPGMEDVLHAALIAGASDTLRKPLEERRLEAALHRLLVDDPMRRWEPAWS